MIQGRVLLAFASWLLCVCAAGQAGPRRQFVVYRSVIHSAPDGRFSIRIVDGRGRTVLRKTASVDASDWSADHAEFAFADASGTPYLYGYRIFVWKASRRLAKVIIPPPARDLGESIFPKGLRLSRDGRHALLLVAATQGDLDIGSGILIFTDLRTRRSVAIDEPVSPGFRWEGTSVAEYSTVDDHGKDSKLIKWKVGDPPHGPPLRPLVPQFRRSKHARKAPK